MAKNVDAMGAQKMGLSPRKAMGMKKIPAMKRGGKVKMVADTDNDGMKSGGKVKARKRGGRC